MKMRAIFIDMDGTLLTASNTISRRNQEAINRLMNQGTKVFLATGRDYDITAPYHKTLGLQTPMICLNGASIHDPWTGKAIQTKPVRLDKERFHLVTSDSPNIFLHTVNGLYCKKKSTEIVEWTNVSQVPPRYIGDLRHVNYPDVLKHSIRTGKPSPELSAKFKEEANIIEWEDGFEMVAREYRNGLRSKC